MRASNNNSKEMEIFFNYEVVKIFSMFNKKLYISKIVFII